MPPSHHVAPAPASVSMPSPVSDFGRTLPGEAGAQRPSWTRDRTPEPLSPTAPPQQTSNGTATPGSRAPSCCCNSLLALVLELAIFGFIGWWALSLDLPLWARILIAVAAVGALIAVWGMFASPKARIPLPLPGTVAVKAAAYAAGALALWGVGHSVAAVVYAVLAAANTAVVTYVRRPR